MWIIIFNVSREYNCYDLLRLCAQQTRLEGLSSIKAGQLAVVIEVIIACCDCNISLLCFSLRVSSKLKLTYMQIYEVAPSLFMVDVRKAAGETLEYHKVYKYISNNNSCIITVLRIRVIFCFVVSQFYKKLCSKLENIIWRATEGIPKSEILRTITFWSQLKSNKNVHLCNKWPNYSSGRLEDLLLELVF